MVPELSRSADHLCHGEEQQNLGNNNDDDSADYSKGPFLKTPDFANRGYCMRFGWIELTIILTIDLFCTQNNTKYEPHVTRCLTMDSERK